MFGIVNYGTFLLSSVLLNLTPGADTIYILSRSAVGGRRVGAASALGISTGILVHTLFASLGLSVILASSAAAFNTVKILGAVYLAFMGIRAIFSKKGLVSNVDNKSESVLKVYSQGVLTNVLNPKVALFFLALLPQFVETDNSFGMLPFLLLGLTSAATSTVWTLIVAALSSMFTNLLNRNEKISRISNTTAGIIYILLGIKVLSATVE